MYGPIWGPGAALSMKIAHSAACGSATPTAAFLIVRQKTKKPSLTTVIRLRMATNPWDV